MASSFEPLYASPPGDHGTARPDWLVRLAQGAGFLPDIRLNGEPAGPVASAGADSAVMPALAQAFAEGEAAGRAAMLAELGLAEQGQASGGGATPAHSLSLSLARLDETMQAQLAERLAETVAMLCEAALAPLALDRAALQERCLAAARLLDEAATGASLRLHPVDATLLDLAFAAQWTIVPDPQLARGTVLFDTPHGGARSGPDDWRKALREALGLC